ncbi:MULTISPECIES: sulfite exporter TauE/SafE family protein [unclassified Streptococcus]|uniref:sulfite exporter TauE/SafE family protein n=1 Tax=unclassified Streptococcus TaxID=2608887 RepID=UPI00107206F3|nr:MULTISPECIES: sulfite exporter TauE/SafE family protein [unclassified Streptococcus]MBF0787005.1 sulfite exporter TauE/SafE family protein [Streptococcus sp. 19428wC2_LYSM12]MCQ9212617.1 sulfite exporter TauE/SafE family protein [Streptococcus sp. B01]MCQ9213956.1 sulfite exporter TauE/SafE family protein [Streptococcus sp. O1]TFV06043.1 sulfite exporter TauE/SafE family protein [Streptococcus sp. LYSM12]
MIKTLLYALVILLANTVGAVSGMGGGIIIKPALQFFHLDSALLINFYSSLAVLTMSISSTWKQIQQKQTIDLLTVGLLGIGSSLGGIIGDLSFHYLNTAIGNDKSVVLQMFLIIVSLLLALWISSNRITYLMVKGRWFMLPIGLFLGLFSTILGIGGGPINISCFLFFFGIGIRKATIYSIITIFFSQAAKIGQALLSGNVSGIDSGLSLIIILAALTGGWIGASISNHISEKKIFFFYHIVLLFVLTLGIFNLMYYVIH